MRALVVYESMFGNTATIAGAIADGLRERGAGVTLLPSGSASRDAAQDFDIVVIGAPTHGFSLSTATSRRNAVHDGAPVDATDQSVGQWLESLKRPPSATILAAFDTRLWTMRHWPASAARTIGRILRQLGATPAPAASFYVRGPKGPLRDGEADRARAWGVQLAERVTQTA